MKFKACLIFLFLALSFFSNAQKNSIYQYTLDLVNVEDDKVKVELLAPAFNKDELIYRIPKTVPGTYSINDYGRFIEDIKFFDKDDKEIVFEKLDENSWKLKDASGLTKVSYWVNDTYDTKIKEDFVFEPAGSNIEENKNFVINTHCFFGYFDGFKSLPYIINIKKPEGFYGSTSLQTVKSSPSSDTYMVPNYMDLADAPMMYNVPDTSILKIGGADILVSVYSPKKVLTSEFVAQNVDDIIRAAEVYLGGKLPIKKYAFIVYLFENQSGSGSYGALEHSYSSMYFLPDVDPELIGQTIKDIATHEFFHIITPLSIHSEEIHSFNFNDPEMSKHLWLYEGVTEYTAGQVQVRSGLIDVDTYLQEMIRAKILDAEKYNDTLPFTELSEKSLGEHKDEYPNVYQKGALIGMALDITLRDLSDGKYGVKNLLKDLAGFYGKDKPFKDDELFDKIAELTYPEIRIFFAKYVEGTEPLPYKEIFEEVGITYEKESKFRYFTLGDIGLSIDKSSGRFVVADVSDLNKTGKELGYKTGDQLVSINKINVTLESLEEFYSGNNPYGFKEGKKMKVLVARKDTNGKEKKFKLSAKAIKIEYEQRHRLELMENPTERQLLIRNSWLKGEI